MILMSKVDATLSLIILCRLQLPASQRQNKNIAHRRHACVDLLLEGRNQRLRLSGQQPSPSGRQCVTRPTGLPIEQDERQTDAVLSP